MLSPNRTSDNLPTRLPNGTRYVIEGRRGKSGRMRIVSRQVILPNGQHIEISGIDRPETVACGDGSRD